MRLTELDPRWLLHPQDGRRVGLTFLCPHCRKADLSCFVEGFPICGKSGEPDNDGLNQLSILAAALGEERGDNATPCKKSFAWTCVPPIAQADFASLTITPSIDASASGCWHGHITNGEIK